MKNLFAAALLSMAMISSGNAAIMDSVDLTGAGSTFTLTNSLVDGGVTFDVTYNVTAGNDLTNSATFLGTTFNGLGDNGGGSDFLNSGETLTFTAFTSNVMGGTVAGNFDFVNVLTSTGTAAQLNNGPLSPFSGDLGSTTLAGLPSADFLATSFQASFTGTATAVPEPGSFAALGFLAVGLVTRRRRRNKIDLTA